MTAQIIPFGNAGLARTQDTACSFCGKSEKDVGKLIAGQKVYICEACIAHAKKLKDCT